MDAWKSVGVNFFLFSVFLMQTPVLGTTTIAVFTTASPQNSATSSAFGTATVAASTSLTSPSLTRSFSASPHNTEASAPTSLSVSPLNTEASAPESLSASPLSTRASPIVTSKASTKTPTAMMTPATSAGSAAVYSVHSSPSSSFNPPPSKSSLIPIGTPMPPRIVYPMITAVTFKRTWGDLCPLLTLFKERLSHHLLEYKGFKDTEYYHVPTDRIILINRDQNCNVKLSYDEEAIVEFYITNNSTVDPVRMAQDETNTNLTRKAYKILYDYWVNHLMVLLHDVFIKQVTKVELIIGGEPQKEEGMTERVHLGIAIGVCLAVIAFLGILYLCMIGCTQIKKAGRPKKDGQMVFSNEVACKEEAEGGGCDRAAQQEADSKGNDEPEEVVVHNKPQTLEKTPLFSAITYYEGGQKVYGAPSDDMPSVEVPQVHPERNNDSQEEPTKPPEETKEESIKSPDEPSGQPINSSPEVELIESSEGGIKEQSKSPDAPEITPGESPKQTETESLPAENPTEPAKEEDDKPDKPASGEDDEETKPDFGQSDHKDEDPTQSAINLAFEGTDEEPDNKKEKDEVNKEKHLNIRLLYWL
ncbi:hypothetical protein pdam_00004737 [Pocillopora damicornis]|uniref:SEA domain-containing protein n=1 Tax=Pocillopora damicornis TaxID=46731 RepID=A0A3M6UE99_POCDA|nr:hypothetical protein pdam_00004737 [Pocillopora damicornis]